MNEAKGKNDFMWERLYDFVSDTWLGLAIKENLLPDNIDIEKYASNMIYLGFKLNPIFRDKSIEFKTESADYFNEFGHRPMGYPEWFMAGYPDVGKYIQENHKIIFTDDRFKNIFDEFEESSENNSQSSLPIHVFLTKFIYLYKQYISKDLECMIEIKSNSIKIGEKYLLDELEQYEFMNDEEIINSYYHDFKKLFGERKFEEIERKINSSKSMDKLIYQSMSQKIAPNGADFVATVLGIFAFSFAKPETVAQASLFGIQKWNSSANKNFQIAQPNQVKLILLNALKRTNAMKFKR